ncbi:MAG: pyruvate kinase [Phycisphaeraceae bacterium]|nr:MAG: pyruvate kinase [Phycisphaeraceae bacterium]
MSIITRAAEAGSGALRRPRVGSAGGGVPVSAGAPAGAGTLTKIVATIGPASESEEMVGRLIEAGVSVFRFNFSHGDLETHGRRLATVRAVSARLGLAVACLGDLQGPKIRVGKVPGGGVMVEAGQDVVFRGGLGEAFVETKSGGVGAAGGVGVVVLPFTYERMVEEVEAGQRVLVNDGAIRMLAVERDVGRGELRCRVMVGGLVTSGKGINLPESAISAPAVTERDWEHARWAVERGFDFLALSFVRRAEDVTELKGRMSGWVPADPVADPRGEAGWVPVIAKIERPQALEDIERIVEVSDGIMVARGDLGVEMDIARVPVAQKRIVSACGRWGKPCIVATQMLETMIESVVPTRAEASDVANAIFDGADAVMLSAETATGRHPALVVETMRRIASEAEAVGGEFPGRQGPPARVSAAHATIAALAHGAWHVAKDVGARAIVVWSEGGGTARYLSQNGFRVPIVAYTTSDRAARRMALLGGVTAVCARPPASGSIHEWRAGADAWLVSRGVCAEGDPVLVLAGKPLGEPRAVNTLMVHRVGRRDDRETTGV